MQTTEVGQIAIAIALLRRLGDFDRIVSTIKTIYGSAKEELQTKVPQKGYPSIEAQKTLVYYTSTTK